MRHLLFAFLILFFSPLRAQEEEVVFDKAVVHGGFGGPLIELSGMADQSGVMVGGGGGVIVNDFFFGGFGQGGSFAEHAIVGQLYPINFGYGGLWVGYVKPTHKALHFFSGVKIAGGSISIAESRDDFEDSLFDETVFVLQPEVGVEVNLWKWFRIALTGNLRVVSGIQPHNLAGLKNSDFNSGGMALTLRFGKFYRNE
ncbi:MAG: hypothetical protein DYG98_26125 [Haliscomenobacteraceae bacterium CHB4]|nr:hypothetical protein [Saprospiraceae bacterium]MCE7926539.1 hypothetical protein [Haliscomenobacteraceae bacterium CHB4]